VKYALPCLLLVGCAAHYEVKPTDHTHFDAVIVPG
jgi:hypothetical protein